MPPLSESEIKSRLVTVPDWQIESGELVRTYLFKDFRAAHFEASIPIRFANVRGSNRLNWCLRLNLRIAPKPTS